MNVIYEVVKTMYGEVIFHGDKHISMSEAVERLNKLAELERTAKAKPK